MANSVTYKGEEYGLIGDGVSDGSIARLATAIRLYQGVASSPAKDGAEGVEFVEVVSNTNGYTTGGVAITVANWTYSLSPNSRIVLDDQVWTAGPNPILDVGGAYLVDAANNVLAWWERPIFSDFTAGDTLTLNDLFIETT